MLTTTDGSWAIFWSLQQNQVLDALARRGLRIETEPKRFTLFGPGE
jgi:hypothetical protein